MLSKRMLRLRETMDRADWVAVVALKILIDTLPLRSMGRDIIMSATLYLEGERNVSGNTVARFYDGDLNIKIK